MKQIWFSDSTFIDRNINVSIAMKSIVILLILQECQTVTEQDCQDTYEEKCEDSVEEECETLIEQVFINIINTLGQNQEISHLT